MTIQYWYSLDGKQWSKLGDEQGPLTYDWSLSHFKGYRIGLFNYAKENTGGYVDFDYYDLSDVLTSDGKAVDTSKLRSAIDQADSLQSAEYPMDEWRLTVSLVMAEILVVVIRPVTVTSRVTAIRPVMAASNSLLLLMIIHLNCHQLVRP